MKEIIRYGFTLAIICALAGGLLAGVNSVTKPLILAQAQAEERSVLEELFPEADDFKQKSADSDLVYYEILDKAGKLIGIAFKAEAKGYASVIETLVGMDKTGDIREIRILSQNETPGLGSRVTEEDFTSRFQGRRVSELEEVDAITGATISSRAVIDSVKKSCDEIKGLIYDQ